jgi:hypothetical protein
MEAASLMQLEDARRGERLRMRSYAKSMPGDQLFAGHQVGDAEHTL